MDAIRKILILAGVIAAVIAAGPFVARAVMPSWGLDRDLASGRIAWRPLSGVLVERRLGENLWEQFIVDWTGPGTIQVIEYADAGGDPLLDPGVSRERLGTKEMRVALEIARLYTLADSPDAFPVVIAQKYQADIEQGLWDTNGKEIDSVHGSIFFAPVAAIEVTSGGRFGLRKLRAGDVLVLRGKRWSHAGPGGAPGPLSIAGGAASFTVLNGVRPAHPMSLENRIAAVSAAMLAPGPIPSGPDESGGGLEVDNDPLAGTGGSIAAMLHASAWAFPLPKELDLTEILSPEQRETLGVPNTISAGWGYSHDQDAIPSARAAWSLRCLEETEIWVPYQSPL